MKRRIVLLFFTAVMTAMLLTGCLPEPKNHSDKKIVTVTTSFLKDMVEQLAEDRVQVETIIPPGEDPHMYIAKPKDAAKLNKADLILYHGLHFEGKMEEALVTRGHAVTEDFDPAWVKSMKEDATAPDPHFWFDVELYKQATINAAKHLMELLPEDKAWIEKNLEDYLETLTALDLEIDSRLKEIPEERRCLITPHDAFHYFSRRYQISVMAPQGVSTGSEVANKDIENTVDFIVRSQVKAIFAESTTSPRHMEKLQEACRARDFDVKVVQGEGQELFSDSLAPEGQSGDTYVGMMRHNLNLIVENLK